MSANTPNKANTANTANTDESPLTIAFDCGPLLGPLTGVGMAVQNMAAALSARDDIRLKKYACSFRGTLTPGMTRLPLPAVVAQGLWGTLQVPRMDRWLKPASVVHGTNYIVPPSRIPRVVTVYDCWFLRHPDRAAPAVRRAGKVLRKAIGSGAVVHASSQSTADAVRELLGTERIEVIALAPLPFSDMAAPNPPVAELIGVPFILALGTLERRKNLPSLVTAFGRISGLHPTLRLVLAGADGDDRPAVDAAVDSLPSGIRSRVMFTGQIEPHVKQWLLTEATVLAYPSLDEGFGFPLLEAMQHGTPVVASNAGSIPEVAGDAALLVSPDDIDGLADALDRVATDDSLRTLLVTAGHSRLTHYSWANTAERLAGLYRRLAREGT